jgi:arylsulfatase A-like enzyme
MTETFLRMILSRWFAVAALLMTVGSVFSADTALPNIVLIYGDDVGYGDLGCYGATRVATPNLDRLAAGGLRFTDAHSTSSTCTPSRYSMMTGEYAWRKKGTAILPGDAALIVEPGRTTFASVLQGAGYTTGVVGKWHLGLGKGRIPWGDEIRPGPQEVGFSYAFIMAATGDRVPTVYLENGRVVGADPADPIEVSYAAKVGDEPTGRENPELLKMHPSHGHDQTIVNGISRIGYMRGGKAARWVDEDMADTFTGKAKAFIEQNRKAPFFLYLATHDIHVPRVPHPRFVGRSPMGPRGDAIAELDWSVGEILETLERLGLTENTLVMFSSDNGPVLDDGYRDQAVEKLGDHAAAGPLRGGKGSVFEGGTRVPFLVRWPVRVKPGISQALVSQVDLLASFAALTGQKLEGDAGPDSFNILPALMGESKEGRECLVEHSGVLALRQGTLKFIEPVKGKGSAVSRDTKVETGNLPQGQLYRLGEDLGERDNQIVGDPSKAAELAARLEQIRANPRSRP